MLRIRFVGARIAACAMVLFSLAARAGPADDLANRKKEWEQVRKRMEEASVKVDRFLEQSRQLRAMDKTELDALITQICKQDIARNDDEGDRLAKSITDKVVENVKREYEKTVEMAEKIERDDIQRAMNDAKSLRDNTKSLTSSDETKSETEALLKEMSEAIDSFTTRVYEKLTADYKTLSNLKEGVINGANNPKIRAAMEYGKEKHVYNQRICEEKELVLSSGRPDCVSFQKEACLVWEFKPDTYSESDARSQAERYLRDVQDRFKTDPRALENCKKDPNGLPIFEARGVTYPACRP